MLQSVRPLTILHTNDLHARLTPLDNGNGGFARLATVIRRERAGCGHCLLVNAGDLAQGSPVSTLFQTSGCAGSSAVCLATPTLTTQASPNVTLGGQIHEPATLTGATNPTGTITFQLYGPDDASCAGAVAFTSPVAG